MEHGLIEPRVECLLLDTAPAHIAVQFIRPLSGTPVALLFPNATHTALREKEHCDDLDRKQPHDPSSDCSDTVQSDQPSGFRRRVCPQAGLLPSRRGYGRPSRRLAKSDERKAGRDARRPGIERRPHADGERNPRPNI